MNEGRTISKLLKEDKNFCRHESVPSEISRWEDEQMLFGFGGSSISPGRLPKIIENDETDLPIPSRLDREFAQKLKPKLGRVVRKNFLNSFDTYKNFKQLSYIQIKPDLREKMQKSQHARSQLRGENNMQIVIYKKLYKNLNYPDSILTGKRSSLRRSEVKISDFQLGRSFKDRSVLPHIRSKSTIENFSLCNSGVPLLFK